MLWLHIHRHEFLADLTGRTLTLDLQDGAVGSGTRQAARIGFVCQGDPDSLAVGGGCEQGGDVGDGGKEVTTAAATATTTPEATTTTAEATKTTTARPLRNFSEGEAQTHSPP